MEDQNRLKKHVKWPHLKLHWLDVSNEAVLKHAISNSLLWGIFFATKIRLLTLVGLESGPLVENSRGMYKMSLYLGVK